LRNTAWTSVLGTACLAGLLNLPLSNVVAQCKTAAQLPAEQKTHQKVPKDGVHFPMQKATFGAGCFWGVEEAFRKVKGVKSTTVGYSGGTLKNPSYEDVCSGKTGHAEVVEVEYDPSVVSYEKLLDIFWSAHDPTQLNRQGPDHGEQYRSVIFYHNAEQEAQAHASKQKLEASKKFKNPIVTQIEPAPAFYRAEDYHQQYLQKRGLNICH
jgi:peptide-methionine (S)-S-oxide reductase